MNFLKRIYLKYLVGYQDPRRYWDARYDVHLDVPYSQEKFFVAISRILSENHCCNVLEIGCGEAGLRNLPGYLGLDFSLKAFEYNGLKAFLFADLTEHIPLPDKCFDAAVSLDVLMHISPLHVERAISEISRIAKKCVILQESSVVSDQPHCFKHDYKGLFGKVFDGKLIPLSIEHDDSEDSEN